MIHLIVWTKDRAMQLSLLLKSLEKYAQGVFSTIDIIGTWSNKDFETGYMDIFPDTFDGPLRFFHQDTKEKFSEMTINSINESKSEYICFSTDDEIIYKSIDKETLMRGLPVFDNHIFSLRLGRNTIVQNCHTGELQPPLNIHVEKDGILTWPITYYHPYHNYGYFGSLDMTIYRRGLLQKILPQIKFNNTNELEGNLTRFRDHCEYISSFVHSVAVNNPINNMSGLTTVNEKFRYSNEELNRKHLDGYEIDLENLSKTPIVGCHQEIEYKFNKR